MENIKMKQASMSFDFLFKAHGQPLITNHYNEILESKINHIIQMIEDSFLKIKGFLFENLVCKTHLGELKLFDLVRELRLIEDWFKQKGYKLLTKLVLELREKKIHKETFEILDSILINQRLYFQSLLEPYANFNMDHIEIILRYIRELPIYLEFDLDLSSLPNQRRITKKSLSIDSISEKLSYEKQYELYGIAG